MWQLDSNGSVAQLELPSLEARLDTTRPHHGLTQLSWRSEPMEALLFRLRWREQKERSRPLDDYIRLHDLIVTYEPGAQSRIRPQVYWRGVVESRPWQRGVELIISMQTDLLDSDPSCTASSVIPCERAYYYDVHRERVEIPRGETVLTPEYVLPLLETRGPFGTYLEMACPSDLAQIRFVREGNQVTTSWHLFSERLEKGVIRRGRLRGSFTSEIPDEEGVLEVMDDFLEAPLPLTT